MKPDIKDYQLSSYVWKEPEPWTPEEAAVYRAERNKEFNEIARRAGIGKDWLLAIGATPEPDIV